MRRLESIDALRGVAAAYVVVYHMMLLPNPHLVPPEWLKPVVSTGGTGVTLFFVISAFSLYYTMPKRLGEASPTLNFYLHRLFRIAPLFYAVMLLYYVRDYLLFGVLHGPKVVIANLLFVFNIFPDLQTGYVWASWTIGVEMLFYLAFPLIYRYVRNIWTAFGLFLGGALLFIVIRTIVTGMPGVFGDANAYVQWTVFRHFPMFACGIIAFFAAEKLVLVQHEVERKGLGLFLILLSIYLYSALLGGWLPQIFPESYYWQGVVYSLLALGCLLNPVSIIVNPLTAFLGKLSYSIYLLHPTIVYFMAPIYFWIYRVVPDYFVAFCACYLLTMGVVSTFSYFTYRFVEEPGIRLGKRLMNSMESKKALKPAV